MRTLTPEQFFAMSWQFSHVESFVLSESEGGGLKTGYIHYINADENNAGIEEESRMSISFPWIAKKNKFQALIISASVFETMFSCENFNFHAHSIPDNKDLLSYFDRKGWAYSLISSGELF